MVCVFTMWSSSRFWMSSIPDKIFVPVSRYTIKLNSTCGCMHACIHIYVYACIVYICACLEGAGRCMLCDLMMNYVYCYQNRHICTQYMHIHICVYMHACIHIYVYTCMHVYTYMCIHACMYIHICVYMHACIHIYVYACIVYICACFGNSIRSSSSNHTTYISQLLPNRHICTQYMHIHICVYTHACTHRWSSA